jgi:hypothetical protein
MPKPFPTSTSFYTRLATFVAASGASAYLGASAANPFQLLPTVLGLIGAIANEVDLAHRCSGRRLVPA